MEEDKVAEFFLKIAAATGKSVTEVLDNVIVVDSIQDLKNVLGKFPIGTRLLNDEGLAKYTIVELNFKNRTYTLRKIEDGETIEVAVEFIDFYCKGEK